MLQIEILKQADGSGVLRCTRQDGSFTWQKQVRHAAHFALHDLTHYAVETTLGYRHGFFGLVAAGWDLEDTTGKGSRGPLPEEAVEVERIVGLLDAERASGAQWTVQEFNRFSPRAVSETELSAVRELRAALFREWSAVTAGEKLSLKLPILEASCR